ncbi:hypothetical protein GWI33_011853 [Rhynchophorus ferrugineus]|uniref:Uncharacterized protein n=1 Tax=Rhynchophorus ferrugineus TaxID=354439 RepID=A0A834M824_RHYFE|nr:hypothetical protein GWI33_011853 [Rhynchophorus ferrugineus]
MTSPISVLCLSSEPMGSRPAGWGLDRIERRSRRGKCTVVRRRTPQPPPSGPRRRYGAAPQPVHGTAVRLRPDLNPRSLADGFGTCVDEDGARTDGPRKPSTSLRTRRWKEFLSVHVEPEEFSPTSSLCIFST